MRSELVISKIINYTNHLSPDSSDVNMYIERADVRSGIHVTCKYKKLYCTYLLIMALINNDNDGDYWLIELKWNIISNKISIL